MKPCDCVDGFAELILYERAVKHIDAEWTTATALSLFSNAGSDTRMNWIGLLIAKVASDGDTTTGVNTLPMECHVALCNRVKNYEKKVQPEKCCVIPYYAITYLPCSTITHRSIFLSV